MKEKSASCIYTEEKASQHAHSDRVIYHQRLFLHCIEDENRIRTGLKSQIYSGNNYITPSPRVRLTRSESGLRLLVKAS